MSNKKHTGLTRRTSGLMALEQRFMFDGAAIDTAHDQLVDATVLDTVQLISADVFRFDASTSGLASAAQLAQQQVRDYLTRATDAQLFELFNGGKSTPDNQWTERLSSLREALANGSFAVNVVAMDSASQFTALAAFTENGPNGEPTIFINTYWFGMLDAPDTSRALVEELGHAFDAYLNPNADSAGDEGESFADTVIDGSVSQEQSTALLTQNDHGQVVVNGVSYDVEFASLNFVNAYHMVYDWDTQDELEDTTERWASKEQNLHYFNTAGLGAVSISDGSNGTNFSGNDVSAVALTIGGQTYNGWISRPIKSNGIVRGFYFWTDVDFTSLALAQADGNQDGDSSVADNRGFVLVVDQTWFNQQIADTDFTKTFTSTSKDVINSYVTSGSTLTIASVGSSSDRVDSALNSVLPANHTPTANSDTSNTAITPGTSGGPALEAGGTNNESLGEPAIGNVLTNDYDIDTDAVTVIKVGTTTADTNVTASSTVIQSDGTLYSSRGGVSVTGIYGHLRIGSDGTYYYEVDDANAEVQALRTTSNTLSDRFTYTISDPSGATATTTLTIKIVGKNDAPVAQDDYNTAKESLTAALSGGTNYDANDPLGIKATGNVLPNDTDVDAGDSKSIVGLVGTATVNNASQTVSLTFAPGTTFSPVGDGDEVWLWVDDNNNGTKDNGEWKAVASNSSGSRVTATGGYDSITRIIPLSDSPSYYWNGTTWAQIENIDGNTFGFKNNNTYTTKVEDGASMKAGVASSSQASSFTSATLSAPVGSIAVGMTVTGTGVTGTVTVSTVTYDGSGNITGVTLSSAITSVNGTSLTFSSAAGTTVTGHYGTLELGANGTYTYTPTKDNSALSAGQSGLEAFDYTMRDTDGLTSTATLYITVLGSGTNDPLATDDSSDLTVSAGQTGGPALEFGEGGDFNTDTSGADAKGNVLSNDKDNVDTDGGGTDTTTDQTSISIVSATTGSSWVTPTSSVISLTGTYGTLFLFTADGNYTTTNPYTSTVAYDSAARLKGDYLYIIDNSNTTVQGLNNGDTLVDSFRYKIENGLTSNESGSTLNLFDIAGINITIQGSNDAPEASNDSSVALEAGGVDNTTPGYDPTGNVLPNDSDVDNTAAELSVQSVRLGNTEGSGTAGTLNSGVFTLTGLYGTLTMNTDGSWSYAVDNSNATVNALAAYNSTNSATWLTEYFNYTVTDNESTVPVDVAVLSIEIRGAADQVSVNDIIVNEGSPYAVFTVLGTNGTGVTLSLADVTTTGLANTALQYWDPTYNTTGGWRDYSAGATLTIGSTNQLLVRTPFTLEKETDFDPNEQFTLNVTPTGGAAVVGTGTIKDDGTGTYFKDDSPLPNGNPNIDPTHLLDDDRALAVNSITVNEGGGYAVFTVSANAGQTMNLALSNGTTNPTATSGTDYTNALEYWNGLAWVSYTAGFTVPGASNAAVSLYVRVAITNDSTFENAEDFKLTATYTSGASRSATGVATIVDDGTGTNYDGNVSGGSPVTNTTSLNDDRALAVNSITVNEGGGYAVFTVSANAGQTMNLALSNGTSSLPTATSGTDYTNALEYWDGLDWVSYTAGFTVPGASNAAVSLYVRVAITNDSTFENAEDFKLTATYTSGASRSATGVATIVDDGTGTKYDGTFTSGSPTTDTTNLDDDRSGPITVTGGNYNENSPRAVFTVNANPGQVLTLDVQNAAESGKAPTGDNEGKPNDSLDTADVYYSLDGGATWQLYTGPITAGNVPVLVAVDISNERDDVYEGEEQLKLVVTSGGQSASGYSSIFDDGTGTVTRNITPQTTNETGTNDPSVTKDDDRPKPAPLPTTPPPAGVLTPAPAEPLPIDPVKPPPQVFNSTLAPIAPAIKPVDPPQPLGAVTTSNSGHPIPVSDTAPVGLSLFQGITDQFVQTTGAATKVSLPFDAFIHSDKNAVIKLQAKQADDSPLPNWVEFDPAAGAFTVKPPKDFKGKLDLKVIARDDDGREAVAIFQMFVGEQDQNTTKPQSRTSFTEKLRMAGKRPVTLVRVADGAHNVQRVRAG